MLLAATQLALAPRADELAASAAHSTQWRLASQPATQPASQPASQFAILQDCEGLLRWCIAPPPLPTFRSPGDGSNGKLGDGAYSERGMPAALYNVAGSPTYKQVAAGYQFSCALLQNSSAVCWGEAVDGGLNSWRAGRMLARDTESSQQLHEYMLPTTTQWFVCATYQLWHVCDCRLQ